MKKLSLLFLLTFLSIKGFTQTWEWVQGGSSIGISRGIAVDAAGNSYVTGYFLGTAIFGADTLISGVSSYVFTVKYDATGNVLWAQKGGGSSEGYGIAVDAAGNSYVTGSFKDTAIFGADTLISSGYLDVFTVKYDALGNVLWAKSGGGSSYDYVRGIAVDAVGNSYLTGYFEGTTAFGGNTFTSIGIRDVFTVKYDASGNVLWAKKGGGSSYDEGYGIAADAAGNSYVTGWFDGTATFGVETITSNGWRDVFTVKYDAAGNVLWAQKGGGSSSEQGTAIAVDAAGNTYVTGHITDTATFGSITLTSSGNWDVFTVKYDSSGNVLWAKKGGGSSWCDGNGIAVDAAGNSYVTGYFLGTATFGAYTLNSSGDRDVFMVKYDAAGNVLWAQKGGGSSGDVGSGIAVDTAGNTYVAGSFRVATTFGASAFVPNALISSVSWIMFIAKLSDPTFMTNVKPSFKDFDISLYPNPASTFFTVEAEGLKGEKQITLMDISGKVLRRESFSGEQHQVAVEGLPKGLYLLRLDHQGASTVQKLIVE